MYVWLSQGVTELMEIKKNKSLNLSITAAKSGRFGEITKWSFRSVIQHNHPIYVIQCRDKKHVRGISDHILSEHKISTTPAITGMGPFTTAVRVSLSAIDDTVHYRSKVPDSTTPCNHGCFAGNMKGTSIAAERNLREVRMAHII